MNASIFSAIANYLEEFYRQIKSILMAATTTSPYLFSAGDLRKEVTEQYPDPISSKTIDDLPPRTRGLLVNEIEKCTGCRNCAKICPTLSIAIETEPGEDASKTWVSEFKIDFSRCIFCGLCVDVCEPQSLTHTKNYEAAGYKVSDLSKDFGRGSITPEHREKWAEIRKQREADEMDPIL